MKSAMLGYTEKEASPPYGLLGAPQQRQSAPLRLVGAGLGVLFGCFVLVSFTTGSLPTLLLRNSAGQLGAWDQCGGMAYTGSTKCPKDYVCSARQPGFSQCVPGWIPLWYSAWRTGDVDDDILVALAAGGKDDAKPASPGPWGQCGGAKYAGPTKCPNDYACKYRSVTLSQCIPSSIAKWIPDYPHNDEPGDKEKSDDKQSKHDSDKDDKPDDDKHGSDKDDKKDDEKGDKKDDEKDDEKDDKKGDKKGDAPSLSLLLAMKSSDVGSCCYSKTGPSDCEHPGDWCSKTEAKCTDCGGTFWTAKQIDDFKHRKDEKKDGDKDDKGGEKDKDDKKDDKKDGGKDDGKKDD